MSPEAIEKLLPLHPEAFRLLVVLREGERHGYALVKELERDPGRPGRVLPANLYRRIRWLLEHALIAESDARPVASRGLNTKASGGRSASIGIRTFCASGPMWMTRS